MVSPLAWVGAEPVFYRIADDLSVDLADAGRRVGPGVRALMATHYFGFPQDMPAVRRFCDDRGLFLIEDCAHCLYGRVDGRPIGSFGDYAIGSPRKFLATIDGGCLVSATRPVASRSLRGRPWTAEALAACRVVGRAIDYGRLPALRPLHRAAQRLAGALRGRAEPTIAVRDAPDSSGTTTDFDGDMTLRMAAFSRWMCRVASGERAVVRRRENYRRLVDGLSGVPGCRPLRPDLGSDVVPYMFPLWVDALPRLFPLLEDAAVPMQRFGQFLWGGVDASVCPVSAALSRHAIQLACHQELDAGEIEAIASRVRTIVAGTTEA
jgi:dTDP-4-amino-4,6-dideoxygalactose transaminase